MEHLPGLWVQSLCIVQTLRPGPMREVRRLEGESTGRRIRETYACEGVLRWGVKSVLLALRTLCFQLLIFPKEPNRIKLKVFSHSETVRKCEISWLLQRLWQNAKGRFHCWEGNERWNNNRAAQQSPGRLLERPCLATGLHTYSGDNYLYCYPACNPPHTHTQLYKHSRFKQERFLPLAGEQRKKNQLMYQDINMKCYIMNHFAVCLSWWCLFFCEGILLLIRFIPLRGYCFSPMKTVYV